MTASDPKVQAGETVCLVAANASRRQELSRRLQEHRIPVVEADDESAAAAAIRTGRPVAMVIAHAPCHRREDFLAALLACREDLPVLFLSGPCPAEYGLVAKGKAFTRTLASNCYVNVRPVQIRELVRFVHALVRGAAGFDSAGERRAVA